MTLDVFGERSHRRVALLRILFHRPGNDGVEIARERTREPILAEPASRSACIITASRSITHRYRVAGENRLFQLGPAATFQLIRLLSGQQLIQHNAQRIHIARGADGVPVNLFRARIVERQRAPGDHCEL